MIIDCIADLHGFYPELEGGDLLIVSGDLTARNTEEEYNEFCNWTSRLPYKKIVVVAGNHDNFLQYPDETGFTYWEGWAPYLCDSGTEFHGMKIWGSPWTIKFKGMNPHCIAFTVDTEEELLEKWRLIPENIDILVTHSPSFGNFDWLKNQDGSIGPSVGSVGLWLVTLSRRPKIHVFGHIHEAHGYAQHKNGSLLVNASIVNEHYKPVNKPIRVIL